MDDIKQHPSGSGRQALQDINIRLATESFYDQFIACKEPEFCCSLIAALKADFSEYILQAESGKDLLTPARLIIQKAFQRFQVYAECNDFFKTLSDPNQESGLFDGFDPKFRTILTQVMKIYAESLEGKLLGLTVEQKIDKLRIEASLIVSDRVIESNDPRYVSDASEVSDLPLYTLDYFDTIQEYLADIADVDRESLLFVSSSEDDQQLRQSLHSCFKIYARKIVGQLSDQDLQVSLATLSASHPFYKDPGVMKALSELASHMKREAGRRPINQVLEAESSSAGSRRHN